MCSYKTNTLCFRRATTLCSFSTETLCLCSTMTLCFCNTTTLANIIQKHAWPRLELELQMIIAQAPPMLHECFGVSQSFDIDLARNCTSNNEGAHVNTQSWCRYMCVAILKGSRPRIKYANREQMSIQYNIDRACKTFCFRITKKVWLRKTKSLGVQHTWHNNSSTTRPTR